MYGDPYGGYQGDYNNRGYFNQGQNQGYNPYNQNPYNNQGGYYSPGNNQGYGGGYNRYD